MSRILRRPMFRGGRVDSRGTGITSGLGYNSGGRVGMFEGGIPTSMMEELTGGANKARSGSGILKAAQGRIYSSPIGPQAPGFFDKLRAIPYLGRAVPFLTGATGTFGSAALTGMGIGKAADFVTRATDSPEAYQFRKDAIRANPFLFDETSTDEFIEFSEELAEKQKEGEAPGLYPGGYDKFLKDKGYVKDEDGRVVKKEKEKEIIEKVEEVPTDTPEIEVKDSKKEESLNVGADLKKTQKLFEELLGMDKARRRDVGDMLGRASAAFLGAPSVREGLADFMRTESATGPGRGEKIGQTAAALAINDYIAGKKSKADLEKLLAAEKFRTDYKLGAIERGLSFDDKLLAAADKEGKSKKSISVIQSVVDDTFGEGAFKGALPKDVNQLEIGAVYVGDSEDKSYKIIYRVNQEKVPVPIKNIF
tara:strand:+ start:168 stop:1433 length:1266 start_codon:yes stop_codon:yes gene_type:complete